MEERSALDFLIEKKGLCRKDLSFLEQGHVYAEQELCKQGIVSQEELEHARALELGLEIYEDLESFSIPLSLKEIFSFSFLKKNLLLPLEEHDNFWKVAVSKPYNADLFEELHQRLKKPLQRVYCSPKVLLEALERLFEEKQSRVLFSNKSVSEDLLNAHDLLDESTNSIVSVLNEILIEAIRKKASDIHLEPKEGGINVRYRIDGILANRKNISVAHAQSLISRIKVMAQLDISERRLPQDGRMKLIYLAKVIDCRVSTLPISDGERVVVRLLDKECLSFDDLGMNKTMKKEFRSTLQSREGIVLVSGPTGSGKSTTLYSAIEELCSDEINIMTIEDPIEYKIASIAQMSVHPKIDLSFARGLRSILRQDPDIIFIGEIRDQETAQIAIQASLTGHLVLSTLHSNDAPSAVTRLLDMGIEPYLISSSLLSVLSQRLLRRICPHCRFQISPSEKEKYFFPDMDFAYRAKGCDLCFHTGSLGRVAIYELLPFSESLKRQILEKTDAHTLKQLAEKEGFESLFQNGLDLVKAGVCLLEELVRVTHNQRLIL